MGIVLVPLGALLLLVGVFQIARGMAAGMPAGPSPDRDDDKPLVRRKRRG
jgi:hypothetical protein